MPEENATVVKEHVLAGLRFRFAVVNGSLRILCVNPADSPAFADVSGGKLWERVPLLIHIAGDDHYAHYGARSTHSMSSYRWVLTSVNQDGDPETGSITLEMTDPKTNLTAFVRYKAFGSRGSVRVSVEVKNNGTWPVTLEQLLICLPGLGRPENTDWPCATTIHAAHNTWLAETQWNQYAPSDLGIPYVHDADAETPDITPCFTDPLGAAVWRNVGTWDTINCLPMGVLEDKDAGLCWFWQIEHAGSWQMEAARAGHAFYIAGGLPSRRYGDWYVTLQPGESYEAAPIGFGCAAGGFEDAIRTLQQYRRKAFPYARDEALMKPLPLIFNDCMQCLQANPTLENSISVIEMAASAGADYYVIDAGWQDRKAGPQTLGDWRESPDRFGESGLKGLCERIRSKGMKVGLWLEIECVSAHAEIFGKPDSWFLCSDGHRVMGFERYFFNFANPEVREYTHEVIDRLYETYGMRYLKLDYNADGETGDNQKTPSLGAGQAASYRGFFRWLEELRLRHPDLLIENCGSGGQRFDYALLGRTHCQSITDSNDERRLPSILAGSLAAGLPEQVAMWCCPHGNQSDEAVIMSLVTPMLSLWHLSGRLDHLTEQQRGLAQEALTVWKEKMRHDIPEMFPFWPAPMRHLHEQKSWLCVGLRNGEGTHAYLIVHRLNSESGTEEFPLPSLRMNGLQARVIFPEGMPGSVSLDCGSGKMKVELNSKYAARLIEIFQIIPDIS